MECGPCSYWSVNDAAELATDVAMEKEKKNTLLGQIEEAAKKSRQLSMPELFKHLWLQNRRMKEVQENG